MTYRGKKGSMWIWSMFIAFLIAFSVFYFSVMYFVSNFDVQIQEGNITAGTNKVIEDTKTLLSQFSYVVLIIAIVVVLYAVWKESQ